MRLVPLNSIKEDSYLAKPIYDSEGRVLLAKGAKLTSPIIKRIEINGILSLYVNDEYSENEIDDIIKPELRQKAIKTVKDSFNSMTLYDDYSGNMLKDSDARKKSEKLREKSFQELNNVVNNIIDEVMSKKDLLINLVDIKSMDDYTYQHCVNVIILSLILGLELKYSKEQLFHLGIGAMLHDIGKVFVPKEVLLKNGRLTPEEFSYIREHPAKGYEYLKNDPYISATSKVVILQHHEKMDGTGYPEAIKGDKIHQYARITAVADVYDALTSDRPYRRALSPSEGLEYLMGASDRHFDYEMVCAFVKRVVPYPVGTIVKLSTGDIGVVDEVIQGFSLRPKVRIVKRRLGNSSEGLVDLMKEKNIVIQNVVYSMPE